MCACVHKERTVWQCNKLHEKVVGSLEILKLKNAWSVVRNPLSLDFLLKQSVYSVTLGVPSGFAMFFFLWFGITKLAAEFGALIADIWRTWLE